MLQGKGHRQLLLLVAVTAGATAGLHQIDDARLTVDWTDPGRWFGSASPEQALLASLRMIGLGFGYWLLASTALYAVMRRRRDRAVPKLVRIVALPAVRRIIDRALAGAVAASIAVGPLGQAAATEPPPPAPLVLDLSGDGIPVPHVRLMEEPEARPPATPPSAGTAADARSAPPGAPQPVAAPTTATTYTVVAGDSLWKIAERQLRMVVADPEPETVATYWRRVVAANSSTIRSGDPNLIYPGELVAVPSIEETP